MNCPWVRCHVFVNPLNSTEIRHTTYLHHRISSRLSWDANRDPRIHTPTNTHTRKIQINKYALKIKKEWERRSQGLNLRKTTSIYGCFGTKKGLSGVNYSHSSGSKMIWFYNNIAFILREIRRANETQTLTYQPTDSLLLELKLVIVW